MSTTGRSLRDRAIDTVVTAVILGVVGFFGALPALKAQFTGLIISVDKVSVAVERLPVMEAAILELSKSTDRNDEAIREHIDSKGHKSLQAEVAGVKDRVNALERLRDGRAR